MGDDCSKILTWLLNQSRSVQNSPIESIRDWKGRYDENATGWPQAVDRAITSGFLADRTAYAFLAGFFAAIQRLIPDLPGDKITAFCISEEGGAHPRAIKTNLKKTDSAGTGFLLNGNKKFITCAPEAESILVAASTGTGADGRNQICLARIDRYADGVRIEPMPDLPFIPEIRHGVVALEDVKVEEHQILPGDAYTTYIKPFRTIEDIHVSAGILGFLFQCAARFGWPSTVQETLLGLVAAIRPLAMADPLAPEIHITFAGMQRSMNRLMDELGPLWEGAPEAEKTAWERDKAVLGIAGKARSARLETAWSLYAGNAMNQ